jgi:ATP-dependent protease ClpP protease subunit
MMTMMIMMTIDMAPTDTNRGLNMTVDMIRAVKEHIMTTTKTIATMADSDIWMTTIDATSDKRRAVGRPSKT